MLFKYENNEYSNIPILPLNSNYKYIYVKTGCNIIKNNNLNNIKMCYENQSNIDPDIYSQNKEYSNIIIIIVEVDGNVILSGKNSYRFTNPFGDKKFTFELKKFSLSDNNLENDYEIEDEDTIILEIFKDDPRKLDYEFLDTFPLPKKIIKNMEYYQPMKHIYEIYKPLKSFNNFNITLDEYQEYLNEYIINKNEWSNKLIEKIILTIGCIIKNKKLQYFENDKCINIPDNNIKEDIPVM